MKKSIFYTIIILVALLLIITAFIFSANKTSMNNSTQQASVIKSIPKISRLTKDLFLARIKEPQMKVIDIRTPEEFDSGHIEDAINIDFYAPDFTEQLGLLDKNTPYSIYCRSGSRSGKALTMMQELGFTDVADLLGGYISI